MRRKAQIQSTFLWIFVAIAGGSFLLIFYQVVTTQTNTASQASQSLALNRLTNSLTLITTSPQTNQTLNPLPETANVTCPAQIADQHQIQLGEDGARQTLPQKPVFTPPKLPPVPLTVISAPHNAPVTAANPVFVIPEDTEIPFHPTLIERLPDALIPFTSPDGAQPINFYGQTTIDGDTHNYYGATELFGILLSNNTRLATCSQQKLTDEVNTFHEALRITAQRLNDSQPPLCDQSYTAAYQALQTLDKQNIQTYTSKLNVVNTQNTALVRNSCPPIY
jgi:hypothetical protein